MKLEIRYHNAMPTKAKLLGLNITAVDECEGGGFMLDKDTAEEIMRIEPMKAALILAAERFREYERAHHAKADRLHDEEAYRSRQKADVNCDMAEICERALGIESLQTDTAHHVSKSGSERQAECGTGVGLTSLPSVGAAAEVGETGDPFERAKIILSEHSIKSSVIGDIIINALLANDEMNKLAAKLEARKSLPAADVDPRKVEMDVGAIQTALSFFPSVIKSGESWSRTCDDILCSAKLSLDALAAIHAHAEKDPAPTWQPITPPKGYSGWTCGRCGGPVAGRYCTCENCGIDPIKIEAEERAAKATAKNPLSDDAKAVAGAWFGDAGKLASMSMTLHMKEWRPTARTQAALDELVAAKIISRTPLSTNGALSYKPIVDCREFGAWLKAHVGHGPTKFQLMEPIPK